MSEAGYVLLHRTLLGHPAFRNDGEAMCFAWMIARASWRPARVRYKGQPIDLQRGQLAVSVRDLGDFMDRPKGWCERVIKRLRSEKMIETHTETGVSVITVCNYDEYQPLSEAIKTPAATAAGTPNGTPRRTPNETPAGQPQDTEQRREEVKKKDSGADAPAQPADILPPFAPIDPEKVMFNSGRAYLMAHGKTHDQAGRLLGQWKSKHGAEAVIVALTKSQRESAEDPVSFIIASLGKTNGSGNHGRRDRSAEIDAASSQLGFGRS